MKLLACAALVLSPFSTALGQESPEPSQASADAKREAAFAKLLTGVTLKGYTTLTGEDGSLQNKDLAGDSYTLKRVSKQEDGQWKFEAVIHYGGKPIPIAVPLPVEWAGDTPMIAVDGLTVPFMGTYDARVVFHGDQYVGVWSGDGYGGHIFGQVVREEDAGAGQAIPVDGGGGAAQASANWPSFRGPGASGVSSGAPTPAEWDLESGKNVRWRRPVEGLAHSSPVIWGDKLFVTTAVRIDGDQELLVGLYGDIDPVVDDSEFRFEVHCYDRHSGEPLWKRVAWTGKPAIARHPKGSHAASTPAVDGERVLAFFGSEGLFAYDHDGNPLWDKSFGVLDSGFFLVKDAQWGFASSPVLHDGRAIVQCDVQDQSFLAVLDAATGKEIWRKDREETPGWSTPTVHMGADRNQIIVNGWKHMGGYDWATGEELWRVVPGGDLPVPTPVVADGLVYLTNAHGMAAPILAIDLKATGTVSFAEDKREFLTWGQPNRGNYMQTPLVMDGMAYFCRDNGVLTCFDAKTGDKHYSERLGSGKSGFTASAVSDGRHLYFHSEEGEVHVVLPGPELKVVSVQDLGEENMASPAISGGVLYYRTRGHLTAIGSPAGE